MLASTGHLWPPLSVAALPPGRAYWLHTHLHEEIDMFTHRIAIILMASLAFTHAALADKNDKWQFVSGTGIHFESEGIEHSFEPTANGFVRTSTDIVELFGDLRGRAVFQPVSVVDLVAGTIVNTGSQTFSGTVLDSKPVVLHDDDFRFEIDINTGNTTGEIYLTDKVHGPNIRCVLQMQGTGRTVEGYNLSDYWGKCRLLPPQ